jgi:polysaccharide biosynthesis protein PslH
VSAEILFLAHRVPFPPDRGDKIRSWNILKRIAAIAPTHVCALWDDERDLAHLDTIQAIVASIHAERRARSIPFAMAAALLKGSAASVEAFASRSLARQVEQLLSARPIRTVFAFSSQMAQFVPHAIDRPRFVMDFVDVDSAKFEDYGGFANRREANRLRAWEHSVAARADYSLFVSEAEASLFRARTGFGDERVLALENGIDLDAYDPGLAFASIGVVARPLIVFTGQMDYPPNADAAILFSRNSLPAIRAIHPNAVFAIVGRKPTADVRGLARLPGVIVTGEVADTREWIAAADVVVAPLKLARGIQNKVLEAMAMGKPVVASPAAAEGIDAERGRDLLVSDGPGSVLALLSDKERASLLGRSARARMVERYSWDTRLSDLPHILGFAG